MDQGEVRVSAPPRSVRSRASSLPRCLLRLSSSFVRSVAELDAAETLALSAGPFHLLPSALLLRGSACGLKIDVDVSELDFVLPLSLQFCPQEWVASVLEKTTVAEPSSPSPRVGMNNAFIRRRPSAQRPPVSWFSLWTASDVGEICLSTRCNPVPCRIETPK